MIADGGVRICQLLDQTLSSNVSDAAAISSAAEALDRLSVELGQFPFHLLAIATGGENQGQRVAAAAYLKNFTRRRIEVGDTISDVTKEFKDQLLRALLIAEPPVLKVLLEAFRIIVVGQFVKKNSWPELVPAVRGAIEKSNFISSSCEYNTVNALMVLHAVLRPFQYFLNPKVAKEPVPQQLERISNDILVPLVALFHQLVEKALSTQDRMELEVEKVLLIICKCIYFSVRSHMPPSLAPLLASFCHNLIRILDSLSFDLCVSPADGYLLRLKTGKRSLLIFCSLVTRHRKQSDKLMPDMVNCALKVVRYSSKVYNLSFLPERIISLAFDVISHVLETGPGWKLVSPHFSFMLDSAIFPALVLNEKDISEWDEDADEFLRKNLPSEIEEVSGWRDDLFTARKSALNLLGVISMSKGPPLATSNTTFSATSKRKKGEKNKRNNQRSSMGELLVLPFLSKFPIPSAINASKAKALNDYFGVLLAYGGLQDFLQEQNPGYITTLVRIRVLPVYSISGCSPYLIAAANWVLGELASCLPEKMSADVYSRLLKGLEMLDGVDITYFPVRASAAGAISALLDNYYFPPEWLALLRSIIGRIGDEDEENIILFQLLKSVMEAGNEDANVHIPYILSSLAGVISKHMHPSSEPWPQVVVRGFEALVVMAETWENSKPEEGEQNITSEKWLVGQAMIGKALSALLQQAWLVPVHSLGGGVSPPSACIEHSSSLLRSVLLSITNNSLIIELQVNNLLLAWAALIACWNAWEESEDLLVFDCIEEVVCLNGKFRLKNFYVRETPSPPAAPVPHRSIIESIGLFVSEAILQYPSATWRACSAVHTLLHVVWYSFDTEDVKQSLAVVLSRAAFTRFREIQDKPSSLWKPLLLAISSCYLSYPVAVERILNKVENGGFEQWVSSLAFAATRTFEPGLSEPSEIKLVAMTLVKVVERLLQTPKGGLAHGCFTSLMEASLKLKELQEQTEDNEDDGVEEDEEEDDEETDYDDEDSDSDEHEETEEEFLERYAKAAAALEDSTVVEEGDVEDQDLEIELGSLEEVDLQKLVYHLIERQQSVLVRGQALPSEVVSRFLNAFPECSLFFQ